MPGMFYSLKETQDILSSNEEQIRSLVRQGKLREFRDGSNLLFKVAEVESLKKDPSIVDASAGQPDELRIAEEEISLVPDEKETAQTAAAQSPKQEKPFEKKQEPLESSSADTKITSEGIDVLTDEDSDYLLASDTQSATMGLEELQLKDEKPHGAKNAEPISAADTTSIGASETVAAKAAETDEASIKEIEDDVNLDTFGSGSGLLDLSLQADDTSLGNILDEIYTAPEEAAAPAQPSDVAAETETMFPDAAHPAFDSAGAAAYAAAIIEQAPDSKSNILGMSLFLPVIVVIYTFIVVFASNINAKPAILTSVKDIINYIFGGIAVIVLIIGIFCSINTASGPAKPKVEKPKAEKPKKEKPKKEKKAK